MPMARPAELAERAMQLLRWLMDRGCITEKALSPVTAKQVLRQEREVLRLLGWCVERPSVQSWIRLMRTRLDTLTGRTYSKSLDWVEQMSMSISQDFIMHQAPAAEFPPRHMAVGIFGNLLIMAQLLPLSVLRPEDLSLPQWELLIAGAQSQGSLPSCPLSPFQITLVKNSLELSSGLCCSDVAKRTQDVAESMRRRSMATTDRGASTS